MSDHVRSCPIMSDHVRSFPIISNHFRSFPINSDQFWSCPTKIVGWLNMISPWYTKLVGWWNHIFIKSIWQMSQLVQTSLTVSSLDPHVWHEGKNIDFSLRGNCATRTHIFHCTIFPFLKTVRSNTSNMVSKTQKNHNISDFSLIILVCTLSKF